jgi:hypothetical protein
MPPDLVARDPAAQARRLFDRDVATQWDLSSISARCWAAFGGAATATVRLDDAGPSAAARHGISNEPAARALTRQCRAVGHATAVAHRARIAAITALAQRAATACLALAGLAGGMMPGQEGSIP